MIKFRLITCLTPVSALLIRSWRCRWYIPLKRRLWEAQMLLRYPIICTTNTPSDLHGLKYLISIFGMCWTGHVYIIHSPFLYFLQARFFVFTGTFVSIAVLCVYYNALQLRSYLRSIVPCNCYAALDNSRDWCFLRQHVNTLVTTNFQFKYIIRWITDFQVWKWTYFDVYYSCTFGL